MNNDSLFYKNLEAYPFFECDQKELYFTLTEMAKPLPSSWHVIVFSAESKKKNDYSRNHIYSFIDNACIAIVLNKIKEKGIDVPFVPFGNYGIVAVPQDVYRAVIEGLLSFQKYCFLKFRIHIKVSSVKVDDCNKIFGEVSVVKTELHNHVHNSHFIGDGLMGFKEYIKTSTEYDVEYVNFIYLENYTLDGLLCPLHTYVVPNNKDYAINLVIRPTLNGSEGRNILTRSYDLIEQNSGKFDERGIMPEEIDSWKHHTPKHIVIYGNWWIVKLAKYINKIIHTLLSFIFPFFGVKEHKIVAWYSDSVKISDTLATLFLATEDEWNALHKQLEQFKVDGYITYGYSKSKKIQLTCYVESYHGYITRFLDGGNGGYRKAYNMLNEVLK